MAGKENVSESSIDKTSFFWTGQCGVCHPGGGPGEYDRDGELYYDFVTGQYGYEKLGKVPADVALDGDYAFLNPGNGAVMPAPWHVTGTSQPDCLLCHRSDRVRDSGNDMNTFWRQATLRSMANLVDGAGASVPAYFAAPTAAQGWFSLFELVPPVPGKPPAAARLQVDYDVGLGDGSLRVRSGELALNGRQIAVEPKDSACWGCHGFPDGKKRGRVWFEADQDVHYAGFNKLRDADPSNDVAAAESTACSACHPSGRSHDFGKGNAFAGSVRNDTDYHDLLSCRDCHLPGPLQDPDAPEPTSLIHTLDPMHLEVVSCQLCHAAYKRDPADLVVDNSVTGSGVGYKTDQFLSADPLDPSNADRTRWYPSLHWKADKDGVQRIFPAKLLNTVWWGDWDQNGTPNDLADDVIEPVILWRIRTLTGGAALPVVTDDNGDGKPEVNRYEEILAYIQALRSSVDPYGTVLADNPVLIKGGRVWHEDPLALEGISSFEFHGTGIHVESAVPFSIDHNVRPAAEAIGSCVDCHSQFNNGDPTNVFDRRILIDPFGLDGAPVYETPRDMLGYGPP